MKRALFAPFSIRVRKGLCDEQNTGTGRERCDAGEGRRLNLDDFAKNVSAAYQ